MSEHKECIYYSLATKSNTNNNTSSKKGRSRRRKQLREHNVTQKTNSWGVLDIKCFEKFIIGNQVECHNMITSESRDRLTIIKSKQIPNTNQVLALAYFCKTFGNSFKTCIHLQKDLGKLTYMWVIWSSTNIYIAQFTCVCVCVHL